MDMEISTFTYRGIYYFLNSLNDFDAELELYFEDVESKSLEGPSTRNKEIWWHNRGS